ncbi:pre-mRNA-splicing factor ISY1 homolog isoform X1 [Poecile atricapillus]|uniref:pre-mRNA-splicing factor ISY1 homolog isoform X1 n=1 Tax=Poecile atricapillus TaxID=48891 RepID=UPI002739DEA0|nr:pre-mRNA-splicing factor ISY1 homolog isoform X1 [Poecile atricapillus]
MAGVALQAPRAPSMLPSGPRSACAARGHRICASGARRRTGGRAGFTSGAWSGCGSGTFGEAGAEGHSGTMARNAEKAMTALARFRQAQLEEGKVKERRPFLASECNELPKAEKWRRQIIGEISKKVAQIQNAGLGEFRIRDLNDEINKLLREKGHWEYRIKELGGPDYARIGPKMLDHEGKEVPGNRGYKYFGAAKDLPGVRELFEKEPLPPPRKTRAELMKDIDAEYYGYRDEDDGILEPLEQEHEKKVIAEAVEKWKMEREARLARGEEEEEENIYAVHEEESDEEGAKEREGEDGQQKFIAHVPVPTQQEIEEALVRRKKMELLQKYASETLLAQSEEAKTLLGL